MTIPDRRRLWWLTVYDPHTGIATRVVGVVGTQGHQRHLSWMPLSDDAAVWARVLVSDTGARDAMAVDVDAAISVADGIVLGFVEVDDPPPSADLIGAVEAAIDRALVATADLQGS